MIKTHISTSKKFLSLLLVAALAFGGCKKFLDVNENPNNPDSADPSLLLPTVEASIGQLVGNSFQVYGGIWSQYWTQNPSSSQYRGQDQYNVANTSFDRSWLILYRSALSNAQLIIDNNSVANAQYYQGIAYLLKAYTVQLATDGFGDIPLSEALKGGLVRNPKYDAQSAVYDSIFTYIDKGTALLGTATASSPGAQDMIFKGDLTKWKAFASTLKLKAYLRLSEVAPEKAAAGIQAIYAASPTFLNTDAAIQYSTTGGNENPLYNEMVALGRTQNLVASGTAVTAYVANNDPRRFKFYDLLPGQDTIAYIPQGTYRANAGKLVAPPSTLVGGHAQETASATAPVKLFSASESYFLQSEAVSRGWASGDAAGLFTQGIRASFTAVGLAAAADAYIANAPDAKFPADAAGRIKAIITQKWYAMNGTQGFEAWTEWRRTGYPSFFVPSAATIIGEGRWPLRFVYPNSEITTNSSYPGTQLVYVPVWWDKDNAK